MNLRKDKKIVHLGIALDESGSMSSIRRETINGVNEQIQEFRKNHNIESTVTIVLFAGPNDVRTIIKTKPIKDVVDLTEKDYKPNGTTAMYDGVGCLLNEMSELKDEEGTSYLLLIVSDGDENSSKEFNSKKIADMINERKKTEKWCINYIGSNQDLGIIQSQINIDNSNFEVWESTTTGTSLMWNSVSGCTAQYLSARLSSDNTSCSIGKLGRAYFGSAQTDTIISTPDLSN